MPASPGLTATWGVDTWANYVLDHVALEAALLASGARRVDVNGKSAFVPRLILDGNVEWTAEGAEIIGDAPTADTVHLVPKALKNLVSLSNESLADSSVDSLNMVGDALTRASARAMDAKAFSADAATAIAPAGLLAGVLPGATGLVKVAVIRARIAALKALGARPNAVYVSGADYAALDAEVDGMGRGLLQPDPTQPGAQLVGGATIWVVPLPAGTCIVAEAQQILCGLRQDATVTMSPEAGFSADSTMVRVVLRADFGINDSAGISVIHP